ncbi:aspartic acid-rich protein [Cyclospora cayetanensis]|uniref:Nucleosome assembly protein n=2 Tax=Cyclospora cayetanensis TaxID=88456 RepID=A0A1D3D240_9EIME|nr:aspartic acid-rich protein [Cyclospora cayetanensis]OEH77520.1 nucleosome assembly protein [Cyclospora cayetanensis]
MPKRERTSATTEEAEAKQRKVDGSYSGRDESDAEELLKPFMEDLEEIQRALQDLDEQCARKQMEVQKEFDLSKKPILEKRQSVLDKIPGFWATAIRNHHMFALMSEADEPVLQHLKSIQLDDNLDDSGSYRIKFVFAEGAKEHFSPLELVKEVRFGPPGPADEEVVEATEICWTDKEKNPVAVVLAEREKGGEEDTASWSLFEWFTKDPWPESRPDVGEVIRREIWHSPVAFFLGDALSEDEDGLSDELNDSESENDEDEE